MQPAFLLALLRACREREIHTAVDTCGYAPWQTLDQVRPYVDLFLYDVKLMNEAEHSSYTGVSNRRILHNLRALAERGHEIVLRVPLIPGITDGEDNIRQIGSLAAELPGVRRVDLLPYHHTAVDKYDRLEREYGLRPLRPPAEEQTARLAQLLRGYGVQVEVGG
jgi:pyruvate formate lyase activating enzyme